MFWVLIRGHGLFGLAVEDIKLNNLARLAWELAAETKLAAAAVDVIKRLTLCVKDIEL